MVGKAGLFAILMLVLVLPLGAGSPLGLDTHVVSREVPGNGYRFLPADVVVDVGGTLTLTNADLVAHDIVAVADGPETNPWCGRFTQRACPLFASPLVGLGGQAQVDGIDVLPVSDPLGSVVSYAYYCSVHPWMKGSITTI